MGILAFSCLAGTISARAAEKRIWIEGEAVRHYLQSFLDSSASSPNLDWKVALSDASNQLRGVELVSDVGGVTVKGFLYRDLDITLVPRKKAKIGQVYRVRMPKDWSFYLRTSDGFALVSHLEDFEFFAKVPALPDRLVIHQAAVDLHLSRATLWLRAVAGMASLVALVDWSVAGTISVGWWDSLLINFGGVFPRGPDLGESSVPVDSSMPVQSF